MNCLLSVTVFLWYLFFVSMAANLDFYRGHEAYLCHFWTFHKLKMAAVGSKVKFWPILNQIWPKTYVLAPSTVHNSPDLYKIWYRYAFSLYQQGYYSMFHFLFKIKMLTGGQRSNFDQFRPKLTKKIHFSYVKYLIC